ncbi:MAG: hypothetical protein A2Z17_01820 [Gammaproteobacteria bacterium RBG_16_66_13]|nr:MAG: hypothetical protein A2Z17_01820 [Gammaproteobacteria bacterium RBG_16_66_13]
MLAAGVSVPAGYNLQGNFDAAASTANEAAIITAIVSHWSDQFTPNVEAGAGTSGTATEIEGGATSTSSINLGRNADGSTSFGLGIQTEGSKKGVSAKTDVAASLDGQRCPNADGQVSFTVKVRLGAESGGTGYTQELTAFVRAVVTDDARIGTTTIDAIQGTRQVKDGRQVYVESGVTAKYDGGDTANARYSNLRTIRLSQDATRADVADLSGSGHNAAFLMAHISLQHAQDAWLKGGCTKIVATSPGTVQPGSNTEIPVKVQHRFDGSEVPSKLEVVLSGEASVEPTSLAKTPGTLTYTAPDESGKTATITLTATSRRGRATLEVNASTGVAAYRIVGGLDDWQTNTAVCDIMKPFTLTGGGFTMQVSGGLSGTYDYTGPFDAHGTGTYPISLPDGVGKPGTMTGTGAGSAGGYTNTGTEIYTLTPIEPCN